jgi:hypothetical protein
VKPAPPGPPFQRQTTWKIAATLTPHVRYGRTPDDTAQRVVLAILRERATGSPDDTPGATHPAPDPPMQEVYQI